MCPRFAALCVKGELYVEGIKNIYDKINNGGDLDEVRNDIISLIKDTLNDFGENINNWQKTFISSAIGDLACNIAQKQKTSDVWLRLCLFNIEKSLTPEDQRDDSTISNIEELDKITYQHLVNAINSLP